MRIRTALPLIVCLGLLGQDTPKFRSDVNLVNVTFTVRDARGVLATDLTKDDFEVVEDNTPQTIRFFYKHSDQPLTLGLVLDASGSQRKFIKDQKKHIRRFWRDVLQPRDKAFIVSFANPIRLVSDLTSSLDQLQDALEEFQDSDRKKQRALFPELGPPEYREQGTAFYDALYLCSRDVMGKVDGRKALVVFSDGEDNASAHHLLDVIEAAQESDVPIYGMRYTELKEGRLTSRNKYGTSVMKRIALETGGREFDASEDRVEQSFKAISEELRSTYEIGYATTNSMKDGGFRKVQIRCKRDGYLVRSKTGYYARVQ